MCHSLMNLKTHSLTLNKFLNNIQTQQAQQVDITKNEEKMFELSVRINKMLEDIEELCNQGEVYQVKKIFSKI